MTPETFVRTYGTAAATVARRLGITRRTVLAQWAFETGWGESALARYHHNLAGIRWYGRPGQVVQIGGTRGKPGTGFAGYRTLAGFLADYQHVMGLHYYAAVRAAGGPTAEMRALGASPWDAGHYRRGGVVGGQLLAVDAMIQPVLARQASHPNPDPKRVYTVKRGDSLWAIASRIYRDGTKYRRIAHANGIHRPYIIHVGQRLIIP